MKEKKKIIHIDKVATKNKEGHRVWVKRKDASKYLAKGYALDSSAQTRSEERVAKRKKKTGSALPRKRKKKGMFKEVIS